MTACMHHAEVEQHARWGGWGGGGGKGNRGKNERRQLDTGREMAAGALYIDLAHDEEYKALFRLLLNRGVLVRSGELR